ncbi:MAG: carbon-monoxide dehydrogenase, large subunit [Chloroflexi bacterium]|nr:carbon-monoxide dehydrogenase, large subunit [Chloroflexota bacterium]
MLVYPAYVLALAGTILTGKPVKWISERSEALIEESFAGDYRISAELAADADGRITALRFKSIVDRGYADAGATPTDVPADFFYVSPGPYAIQAAFLQVDGVRTNKAPSGVALRRSFRVTDTVVPTERLIDILAHERGDDPADLRLLNLAPPASENATIGWGWGPVDFAGALRRAMERIGYAELRKEQAERRARGELMGIGIATFAEILGGGPARVYDILGARMIDGVEVAVRPDGRVELHLGLKHRSHASRDACSRIVAEELGVAMETISVAVQDGMGWEGEESAPNDVERPTRLACRRLREMGSAVAARMLKVSEQDVEWNAGRFATTREGGTALNLHEIATAADADPLRGWGPPLLATSFYKHPEVNYPYGAHICAVDVDRQTGAVSLRRFLGVHGFGNADGAANSWEEVYRPINKGLGPALYEAVAYDSRGVNLTSSYADYLLPTAMDVPTWEPSDPMPPRPYSKSQETNAAGEYPSVGAHAAVANAVVDALWHLGVRHVDIPVTAANVWKALRDSSQ